MPFSHGSLLLPSSVERLETSLNSTDYEISNSFTSPVFLFMSRLMRAKDALHRQNSECARVRSENMELEEEMNQLEESHKSESNYQFFLQFSNISFDVIVVRIQLFIKGACKVVLRPLHRQPTRLEFKCGCKHSATGSILL